MKTVAEKRAAQRAATKRWKKDNSEWCVKQCRKHRLKKAYGLTEEGLEALLEEQNNCCVVCNKPFLYPYGGRGAEDIVIDHKHGHKRPRGALHRKCNTMLGIAGDNPTVLRAAAEYLERYNSIEH